MEHLFKVFGSQQAAEKFCEQNKDSYELSYCCEEFTVETEA